MSSMKEKAIVAANIIFRIEHSRMTPKHALLEEKWVKLEEVQELEQKVRNLETNRENLLESLEICTRNLKLLCKESVEFKQKLDAFHGFLVKVHNQSRDVKVNAFLGGIIKKFEELKEEKEA